MKSLYRDNKQNFLLFLGLSIVLILISQRMAIPFYHSLALLVLLFPIFFRNPKFFVFLLVFSLTGLVSVLLVYGRDDFIPTLISVGIYFIILLFYHLSWRFFQRRFSYEMIYSNRIINQINDGVAIWDETRTVLDWNHQMVSITGIPKIEAVGNSIKDLILSRLTPDSQNDQYREWLNETLHSFSKSKFKKLKTNQFLLKLLHEDGNLRYLQARVFLFNEENQRNYGAIVRDVTEQREISKTLETNQARFNAILEDQTDMICRYDLENKLTYVNDAFCKHAGLSREELLNTLFLNLVSPEEREKVLNTVRNISFETPLQSYQIKVDLLGEQIRWESWTDRGIFNIDGELIEYQAVGRDITAQKLVEDLLMERGELLNTLTANAPGIIFIINSDGEFILSAGSGLQKIGLKQGEIVGKNIFEVFSEHPQIISVLESALEGNISRSEINFHGFVFAISFSPFYNASGDRTGLIGIGTDTTEQLKAQQDLRENQEILREIFKAIPAPFLVWRYENDEFYLSDFNDEAARKTEYKIKDFIGMSLSEYYVDIPEIIEDIRICFNEKRPTERAVNFKMRTTGKVVDSILRANFVSPDLVMLMYLDITDQKIVERNLQNRIDELTALRATLTDISSHLDLEQLLASILERAVNLLGSASGEFALYNEETNKLRIVASYNMGRDYTRTIIEPGEGVMGRVLESGKPIAVDNYASWDGRLPAYTEIPWKAGIGIPLRQDGRLIGVIGVVTVEEERVFSPADARLLMLFAQQASIAIENANLYLAAEQRASEAITLQKASAAVASTLNQEEAIRRILEELSKVVSYDSASIQLLEGNDLVIVGGGGYFDIIEVIGTRFTVTENDPAFHVLDKREFYIIDDIKNSPYIFKGELGKDIRSWMAVPMILRDRIIGVLTLDNVIPGFYSKDNAQLVSAFADQVAIAIENARLYQEAQQLAITDPLTDVYNRRFMEEALARELLRLDRHKRPLGVIMLDIDYFKVFNDNYGHTAGDALLVEMAKYIKSSIRGGDFLCRYGGEEFLMILPELNLIDTVKRAEEIRKGVMNLSISFHGEALPPITASFGVANFNEPDTTVDDVLRVVDTALYKAKESGRNCVKVADLK